jgi:transcriptional regulator with XRE-family HTH domain
MLKEKRVRRVSEEERVLAKSVLRAANRLGISQKKLAVTLGVSASTISRIKNRSFALQRNRGKAFELAVLFVRLYLRLDAIVGGEDAVARSWLGNWNNVLQERPIDLVESVRGLVGVVQYLDERSKRF